MKRVNPSMDQIVQLKIITSSYDNGKRLKRQTVALLHVTLRLIRESNSRNISAPALQEFGCPLPELVRYLLTFLEFIILQKKNAKFYKVTAFASMKKFLKFLTLLLALGILILTISISEIFIILEFCIFFPSY